MLHIFSHINEKAHQICGNQQDKCKHRIGKRMHSKCKVQGWKMIIIRQMQKISNISNESKYHSFLIAQTEDKELAQKWQYYILSSNGQLLMNTEESKSSLNYQYNISIDTVAYELGMGSTRLILSQGNWLKTCLSPTELQLLDKMHILRYDSLVFAKTIRFYYYAGSANMNMYSLNKQPPQNVLTNNNMSIIRNTLQQVENQNRQTSPHYSYGDQFVQIRPRYIHKNDCLIFQIDSPYYQNHDSFSEINQKIKQNSMKYILPIQHFKNIHKSVDQRQTLHKNDANMVNFRSEYALISDQHFLNCLVRGEKPIGSYLRTQNFYVFCIDQQIYATLRKLYAQPKL